MSGSDYERELKEKLIQEGWLVFRVAGSFVCDLVALRYYPEKEQRIIEVKSTKADTFYTSDNKEQFDILNNHAKEGFNVYYYIRWKGVNKWSKYHLPLEPYPIFRRDENDN